MLYTCKPLPYGQLTTALVRTVPCPWFLRQSATITKVIETFWCPPLHDRRVSVGDQRSWLGPGLVHSSGLFRQFFEITEKR